MALTQNQQKFLIIAAGSLVVLFLLKLLFGGAREGFQAGADTFVMYYADWCPHCKPLKPIFKEWSKDGSVQVNGKTVFLEMVEADADAEKVSKAGVKGFPTFILHKANGSKMEFDGERTKDGWEAFLKSNL